MANLHFAFALTLSLLLCNVSAAPSTTLPAKIVSGFFSNVVSAFTKLVWSLKAPTKTGIYVSQSYCIFYFILFFNLKKVWLYGIGRVTAIGGKSMMKFESGYTVETVFDGSKLGIEPYAVEVLHNGELLILDSVNSNIYRISSPLSLYSRPKLVAGSAEGYSGHVDGRLREARMNHPKGITVDNRGNIYVADIINMAIRKISDSGVTTIAGGKWSRGGGHVDGPSEEAKFSNDFDVVYVGSSCSLLVIDRGNQAIREIQLHFDDCAYQYENGFPLGIAMLVGAGFFGYMLALLQRRLGTIVASQDAEDPSMSGISPSPYQKPLKSVRPPLIPSEDESDKQEESFFGSIGKLLANAGASVVEIMGGVFPGFRKKPQSYEFQSQPLFQQPQQQVNVWPVQESFVIPDEDEPPSIDPRTPTPRKTYAFMSKDAEKMQQLWQSRAFYSGWDGDLQQQQQQLKHQQQQQQQLKHHHRHQYHSSIPHTYYEQSHEETKEILFGAVQEQDGKQETVVIKPVEYGQPLYDHHYIRPRISSMGYINQY
ncbi:argonaute 1B [Spatholobus suberectus]|nr:argonaute 1B [Spatholobus suberectus]